MVADAAHTSSDLDKLTIKVAEAAVTGPAGSESGLSGAGHPTVPRADAQEQGQDLITAEYDGHLLEVARNLTCSEAPGLVRNQTIHTRVMTATGPLPPCAPNV